MDTPVPLSGQSTPRSSSPEPSSASNSTFLQASNTIDSLARALSNFSRVPTPEPPTPLLCCCERENCEATLSWLLAKSKLEKNLELSAEVGQALLQRHEGFVRRHEKAEADHERAMAKAEDRIVGLQESNTSLIARLADLVRESTTLEKRLSQANLNLEVADASNRALLKELQDTRTATARLTAQNARSTGWEAKLSTAERERDDLQQEVEAERSRSRSAEAKAAAADAKCSELESELFRLRTELDSTQISKADLSEALVRDARARLEGLQGSLGLDGTDNSEINRILESLVADNEAIKRDNAELQNILAEAREDLKAVREELAEHQAAAAASPRGHLAEPVFPVSPFGASSSKTTPASLKIQTHSRARNTSKGGSGWLPPATALISSRGHRSNDSWATSVTPLSPYTRSASPMPSASAQHPNGFPWTRRSEDTPPKRSRSIDSPIRHNVEGARASGNNNHDSPTLSQSALPHDTGDDTLWVPANNAGSPEKPRARPRTLMLLSRSRGVQTDGTNGESLGPPALAPRPLGATAPRLHADISTVYRSSKASSVTESFSPSASTPFQQSTNSETSSLNFSDPNADPRTAVPHHHSVLPSLIDKVSALQLRVSQADVRSLVNRLRRQNIIGGDVGHLSRATLKSIMAEVDALRGHFKAALDAAGALPSEEFDLETSSIISKKDLRALLKLAKDILTELVQLRTIVNSVTLDPSGAARLKDQAFSEEPSPPLGSNEENERGRSKLLRSQTGFGWIAAPIQKLFNGALPPLIDVSDTDSEAKKPKMGIRHPRAAPKLAPAVAATTATVNVEFGSTGTRGATVAESPDPMDDAAVSVIASSTQRSSLGRSSGAKLGMTSSSSGGVADEARSRDLLGIFAGAPASKATSTKKDSWVVIPKTERRSSGQSSLGGFASRNASTPSLQSNLDGPGFSAHRRLAIGNGAPGPRASAGFNPNRLSRIVDAVIDDNASIAPSERDRTLRHHRNLSDSSIHSTFVRQSPVHRLVTPAAIALSAPSVDVATQSTTTSQMGTFVDRESVFKALSRTVQSFTFSSSPMASSTTAHERQESGTTDSQKSDPVVVPSTVSTASPPRQIPSTYRHPRGAGRSQSRKRDPSPGNHRVLGFVSSWMPTDSAGGTPSASMRDDSPLSGMSRMRRDLM